MAKRNDNESASDYLKQTERAQIGTKVTDLKGNDLGKIVGGSVHTGRWQVKGTNGKVTTVEGPQLIEKSKPTRRFRLI